MGDSSQSEPSMEEILASIRRIISEDGEDDADTNAAEPEMEEPAAEPDPEPMADLDLDAEPEAEPEPEEDPVDLGLDEEDEDEDEDELELVDEYEDDDDVLELVDEDDDDPFDVPPPPPPPSPTPALKGDYAYNGYTGDRLVSHDTESFGVATFAKLERSIRMGQAGETLEDVVKGLLRPMLQTWLDDNLPKMVERLVEEEIKNMSSGAKRRWDDDDY